MKGEIIAIGDELTSGRIANTTSGFAARELFAAGHEIVAMHTIGDVPAHIGDLLKKTIDRTEFIIVTGGLGSTSDDLTNDAVAEALDRPVTLHHDIQEKILHRLQKKGSDPHSIEKMALLPEGAEVLNSEARMAGYLLVHNATPIFFLPGVPSQMRELMTTHVLPHLAAWKNNKKNYVRQRVYKTLAISENEINRRLLDLENRKHVKIGYYPVGCEVHISLTVWGSEQITSDALFAEIDHAIATQLGDIIYGHDHQTLASVVGDLLLQQGKTLSVAESCTGGRIGSMITAVPGSSAWFSGGVIAYANTLKEILLGVDRELLEQHGAVSAHVARAMAARLADRVQTDLTVSVTGIAGPDGGSVEKPVGTVYIGLFHADKVRARLFHFSGDRRQIQEATALTALDTVRRELMNIS